jgi:hypothetical protein
MIARADCSHALIVIIFRHSSPRLTAISFDIYEARPNLVLYIGIGLEQLTTVLPTSFHPGQDVSHYGDTGLLELLKAYGVTYGMASTEGS